VRDVRRRAHAFGRQLRDGPAVVHYFHQVDDPYSHLMLQALPALAARYAVRLQMHLVPPPGDSVAPDRVRLVEWSRRDAADLSQAIGLEFEDPGQQPEPECVLLAMRALTAALARQQPIEATLGDALHLSRALWRGDAATLEPIATMADSQATAAMQDAAQLRQKLGHYLGATLHFEGEWYWGVDRLACLEQRLHAAGLTQGSGQGPIVVIPEVECRHRPTNDHRPELHFFCSLRSPYTHLAVARVRRLAERYGAGLRLRYVLPMVMRGLPVPREKRLYILLDAKREAERLGLPFGRIVDPVGVPTERGLAVLHHAVAAGRGPEFLESFMRGVWTEGLDAGSDRGLHEIARRAGLDSTFVAAALRDAAWHEVAAANREDLLALGLWGVPTFRVDTGPARWGQDRLWRVERDLIVATEASSTVGR
jgi:2-hydroxychromene-2-carboxylate isomerase